MEKKKGNANGLALGVLLYYNFPLDLEWHFETYGPIVPTYCSLIHIIAFILSHSTNIGFLSNNNNKITKMHTPGVYLMCAIHKWAIGSLGPDYS